jgi:hypothetical protein
MKEITADRLREVLSFDPETGVFRWKKRLAHRVQIGDVAGYCEARPRKDNRTIYYQIGIDGRLYQAHRLAWLYVHGEWPTGHIDHLNGDGADNRIANLRDCAPVVNYQNRRVARVDSKTGLIGAFKNHKNSKYHSKIRVAGKQVYLGTFDSPEDAHVAFVAAKRMYHQGCTL